MTLVYRSSKQKQQKPLHDLGPGSYHVNDANKNKNAQKSCIFLSSTQRDTFEIKKIQKQIQQKNKNKKMLPPPTTQQQSQLKQITNNIINSNEQNISNMYKTKISSDCNHVFNSKVKRFSQTKIFKSHGQNRNQMLLAQEFKKLLLKGQTKSNHGQLFKTKNLLEKHKMFDKQYQFFPSIPNWDNSYGYKQDPSSNKWVSNQNPSIMLMFIDRDKQIRKNNCSLGPGYYFTKNSPPQHQKPFKKIKTEQAKDLLGSIIYPNNKPLTPIHKTIQQNQNRLKLKAKLLARTPIPKEGQTINNCNNYDPTKAIIIAKDKKQFLLANQMIKKFGQFISKQSKQSPLKYIQKLKQTKASKKEEQTIVNELNLKRSNTQQHFMTRSQRFSQNDLKNADQLKQQQTEQAKQQKINKLNENSSVILQSHNCKQPYSKGEHRFKENYPMENLGPGTYYSQKSKADASKVSPCFNMKSTRFDHYPSLSELPGPGDYKVSKQIVKNENILGTIYSNYKKLNNEQIRKNFKRQDSMQSLYLNWGRQMNYIAKLQHQTRPQQKQENEKLTKQNENKDKSLLIVKKQLQSSLIKYNQMQNQQKLGENIIKQKKNSNFKPFRNELVATLEKNKNDKKQQLQSNHPKIKKHLYEYKQQEKQKYEQKLGPGCYQTEKSMVKKTFNMTYD